MCDAEDDYSKGYDDAITIAIDILLEETGYCIEEILDYEEDEEEVTCGIMRRRRYGCLWK